MADTKSKTYKIAILNRKKGTFTQDQVTVDSDSVDKILMAYKKASKWQDNSLLQLAVIGDWLL